MTGRVARLHFYPWGNAMRAGKGQQRLLTMYAIVVALLLLFPPYEQEERFGERTSLGHGFIFSPPHRDGDSRRAGRIDAGVLAIHLAGVTLIAGALWVLLKARD